MATKPTGRPNGRPPKPVEIRRGDESVRQDRLPDAPLPGEGLAPAEDIPPAPPLSEDGQAMWDSLWTAGRRWLSPDSDMSMMIMLCQAFDESEAIRRALALGEVKRFYTLANGQQVTHPMVTQLRELRAQMTAWLSSLGFSPTDRARLGLAEVRTPDALDDLQARREARKLGRMG